MDNIKSLQLQIEKAKIAIREQELKIAQLKKDLFDLEFVKMSWVELEEWLLKNGHDDYRLNPQVTDKFKHEITYCKIVGGEMQVGAYYNNDRFPRGCDLYVSRNFKPYRK